MDTAHGETEPQGHFMAFFFFFFKINEHNLGFTTIKM